MLLYSIHDSLRVKSKMLLKTSRWRISLIEQNRASSNLENLEMSGNLKVDPKSQGKVREVRKEQYKSGNSLKILNCRPSVSHFIVFLTTKNVRTPTALCLERRHWSGKVMEKSGNFYGQGGWTP